MDENHEPVPPGDYTYYIWAFNNVGAKEKMCHYQYHDAMGPTWFITYEEDNTTVLNNPICCQLGTTLIGEGPFYGEKYESLSVW